MVKRSNVEKNLKLMREKGFGISQIRKLGIARDMEKITKSNPAKFKKMLEEKIRLMNELKLSESAHDKEIMGKILIAKKSDLDRILENEKLVKEFGIGSMGEAVNLLFGPTEEIHELAELVQPPQKPKKKWWKIFGRK